MDEHKPEVVITFLVS